MIPSAVDSHVSPCSKPAAQSSGEISPVRSFDFDHQLPSTRFPSNEPLPTVGSSEEEDSVRSPSLSKISPCFERRDCSGTAVCNAMDLDGLILLVVFLSQAYQRRSAPPRILPPHYQRRIRQHLVRHPLHTCWPLTRTSLLDSRIISMPTYSLRHLLSLPPLFRLP